jgi:hypothetical protein
MKWLKTTLAACLLFLAFGTVTILMGTPTPAYAADTCANGETECCQGGSFLGFPKWYKYLESQPYRDDVTGKDSCIPKVNGIDDIWRIVAAVIEMLTRVASLIAIGFVVYGGITYTLSQGNPDKTKQALKTIINAVVGLAIAIISTALVSFIAGRFN